MAVGFKVDSFWYQIGSGDFLYSFFSTVAYHLENGKWGKRFPVMMNDLYRGKINSRKIKKAIKEVEVIKEELKKYTPDKVVWDIDDLTKQPPWGDKISTEITDLSNYFVTNEGEDFITVLLSALNEAKDSHTSIEIEPM
ncbi:MAG: immunity 70 family protein [Clostridium sp.]|nr:immunity 70 family protein [Clostridium sp.]